MIIMNIYECKLTNTMFTNTAGESSKPCCLAVDIRVSGISRRHDATGRSAVRASTDATVEHIQDK